MFNGINIPIRSFALQNHTKVDNIHFFNVSLENIVDFGSFNLQNPLKKFTYSKNEVPDVYCELFESFIDYELTAESFCYENLYFGKENKE